MKLISIAVFLLLCMGTYAQERFNKIIYDNDPHIGNTVIVCDSTYVMLTGTLVNGERGIALTKVDKQGNVVLQKKYRKDNYLCYEGRYNCMKYDSITNLFYLCGLAMTYDYQNKYPFFVELNENLDTIIFKIIEVDSVYTTVDVIKLDNTHYAITGQIITPDDTEMGLMIYGYDETVLKIGYGVPDYTSNEASRKVIKTTNNEILLGGFSFGFNSGNFAQDWYLVKTDSIGNMIWQQHYGNPVINDGYISGMLQVSDTSYMLCGGQGICNDNGDAILEGALRMVDTSGNLVWEKFYRHYLYSQMQDEIKYSMTYFTDLVELEDSGYAGLLYYADYYTNGRFLVMKLTSDGKIIWTRRLQAYEELGLSEPSSIKQTHDSGFIIQGYANYPSGQQFFLIKTDSLGVEGSVYPQPPPELINCTGLPDTLYCEQTYSCKLQVQGKSAPYTLNFSTGEQIDSLYYPPVFLSATIETGTDFDVLVGLTNYTHSYDSATIFNETQNEESIPDYIEIPFSITVPENYTDTTISVGLTNGIGESYEITLPVYVDCNVSSEPLNETAAIQVYPNPATDYLQIQLPDENETSFVKILNLQGQTVLVQPLQSQTTRLDISGLAPGTYMVRLYYGHRIENVRMEKQ
ncbi:MAG TPA: T9SS type A sorting domain-containing protein [Bacteroidales bacterium]|nr:T9SS type A sorting domain-containing protein [Bacteroidales bacterium]